SQTPWTASYATAGSEAANSGPGGVALTVVAGRKLRFQLRPASTETAVPMFDAAPFSRRPTWKAATTVDPKEKLSGSTAVSCWLSPFAYGSTDRRRDTISQLAATTSLPSALTTSFPGPQSTRSLPPKAACTRLLPPAATRRSGCGVPRTSSPRFEPWIVAAVAVDASRSSSRTGRRRRTRTPQYPRAESATRWRGGAAAQPARARTRCRPCARARTGHLRAARRGACLLLGVCGEAAGCERAYSLLLNVVRCADAGNDKKGYIGGRPCGDLRDGSRRLRRRAHARCRRRAHDARADVPRRSAPAGRPGGRLLGRDHPSAGCRLPCARPGAHREVRPAQREPRHDGVRRRRRAGGCPLSGPVAPRPAADAPERRDGVGARVARRAGARSHQDRRRPVGPACALLQARPPGAQLLRCNRLQRDADPARPLLREPAADPARSGRSLRSRRRRDLGVLAGAHRLDAGRADRDPRDERAVV